MKNQSIFVVSVALFFATFSAFADVTVDGESAISIYNALNAITVEGPLEPEQKVSTKTGGGLTCTVTISVRPAPARFSCTLSDQHDPEVIYNSLRVLEVKMGDNGNPNDEIMDSGSMVSKNVGSLFCSRTERPSHQPLYSCELRSAL